MIDRSRCMAPRDALPEDPGQTFIDWLRSLGGPRCQEPATHATCMGRRCAHHAEELRRNLRNPHALGNVLCDGRRRTEEEIARLVVELPSTERAEPKVCELCRDPIDKPYIDEGGARRWRACPNPATRQVLDDSGRTLNICEEHFAKEAS